MKKLLALLCPSFLVIALLTGCSGSSQETAAADPDTSQSTDTEELSLNPDMFTDRDCRTSYDEEDSIQIKLQGDTATASSDSVQISGSTITITEEATYVVSGTLDDGMILVNAEDSAKLQIVLDGADITSETSAALYILEADKVFVTLADGSTNALSNGGTFTAIDENNIDSTVFSKQDLTFNGSGSLTVTSPAGHGIVCKDDLVSTGGTYTIHAASHGLEANDSVRLAGNLALTIDAGKDGIHCENDEDTSLGFVYVGGGSLTIEAEGDGISAGSYLQADGGSFEILAGGGSENGTKESSDNWGGFMGGMPGDPNNTASSGDDDSTSMKGLKATGDLLINGGTFQVDSADDSFHSNASVAIASGSFAIASGDDAVHADETLTITDCDMDISESYEGLEALDLCIEGGTIRLTATDDGLNAAGGTDASGTDGGRDEMFGGGPGNGGNGPMGNGGGGMAASNGSILISGGSLYINASGDGIDANGTLEITGGYLVVSGPTQGDTATLDYDVSGTITGGTFIGTGASGMAQTFSSSGQGVLSIRAGRQTAGTRITVTDSAGNSLFDHTPDLDYEILILSSPDLVSGETYTVTIGTSSGQYQAD